jgi:hypothetical protein
MTIISKIEQLRAEKLALIAEKDREIEQAFREEREMVLADIRHKILMFNITYRELKSYVVRPPEEGVKRKSLEKKKTRRFQKFDLLGEQITDVPKRGRKKKLAMAA